MYTAMGYPPYLFDHAASQEIFPCLQPGSYNRLLEFYEYCADHDIPITCHGSPQGMTLADPGVYLKEYLKKRVGTRYARSGKINFCINGQGFMHGIGLVDTFSSPLSWEKVIDRMSNGSELKLCLAHFGGKDFLSGTYPDTNTPYAWLNNLTGLIKEGNKVYTDISCFTFDSFRPYPLEISPSLYNELNNKIEPGLIGRMYTRYSDLQGDSIVLNHRFIEDPHISDETKRHMMELRLEIIAQSSNDNSLKAIYGELVHTAEKLASLIEQKEILRYRIMFGTDWPLMELGVTGVPAYNSAIFVLLQLVSKKLKNRWDAWHQFAVINPLRFLGLLNPPDNTAEEYSLDFTKIDKMKENIESYLNDKVNKNATEYRDVFAIVGTIIHSKLERNYQSLKYFGKDTIRSASKMTINNNSTLLLTNGRVGS
jgi:predicted TIM-barrel fold metal-dependent hydrolase